MKILVISGFLGAGKTTFIKELAKRTKKDFVVMENEYGESNIDSTLLNDGKLNIWELTEGCVCCTMKSDFASSILTIANTLDPEYLVVEPTGVGKLSQVMQNIKQIEYERIQLLEPITLVDSHSFYKYLKLYDDIYKDQIMSSKYVILSKSDLSSRHPYAIKDDIEALNPQAQFIYNHYSFKDDAWFDSLLQHDYDAKDIKIKENQSELESFGIKNATIDDYHLIVLFFERLIRGYYGQIIRAKGFFKVHNHYFQFDVVDDQYSIIGATSVDESEAIFIGQNINRSLLREYLISGYKQIHKKIPIQIHKQKKFINYTFENRIEKETSTH